MKSKFFGKLLILTVLVSILPGLFAQDRRTIPLDVYLVIDGSSALESSKTDVVSWINQELVDRILADGDKITVWNAGDQARIIYSDTVSSSGKNALKDRIKDINTQGRSADFSGALRDVSSRVTQTPADRISYTLLITASAEVMEPALSGSSQNLFRWFRSEKYERWQVLVLAPDIGEKVRQNAQAYMRSIQ